MSDIPPSGIAHNGPNTDITDLARLAEAATPGPWEMYDANEGTERPLWAVANDAFHNPPADEDAPWIAVDVHVGGRTDAEFIAAANPATILRLLDECASLQEDASGATQRAEHAEAERDEARANVIDAMALVDQLAARLAAVEVEHEALADSLRAEAAQIVSQVSDEPMRQPTPLDELLGIDPNDTAMRLAARAVQAQRQLTLFARRLAAVEALLGRWHEYADPADLQDDLRAALAAPTDTTKEN